MKTVSRLFLVFLLLFSLLYCIVCYAEMEDDDLDLDEIQREFLNNDFSSNKFIPPIPPSPLLSFPPKTSIQANKIDYDYLNFDHLTNNGNINIHRDKEWKFSSNLEEKLTFEQELFFDLETTYIEKQILLKNKNCCDPKCKYCQKKFKLFGKALINHEKKCFFNPSIAKILTLKQYISRVLGVNGNCPKCGKYSERLRGHAKVCMAQVEDFSNFLPTASQINMNLHENNSNISHENLNRIEENNLNEVNFASELPFTFHNTTFLTESEITAKKSSKTKEFSNYTDKIIQFKNKNPTKFIILHLNINSVFNKVNELDEILRICRVDAFTLNESKLDIGVPISWYTGCFFLFG